nr:ATP-binding protein [Dendronalium sp. ChiSLP03b]MDZ8203430.1 ATP-binding protein [Dendronalium sp. ChiSLP03b]
MRTMQRLREEGVQCAAVDLSAGGIQNVPPEQWYADLIDTLIDTFELDVDFGDWWEANQLNSLVTRFRKFLEEILLVEVRENIVIFIDEIDSVLSLNFPTDDFFALIRACYNKRVDNPELLRLTFCLLGVASPSNLIEDKQRTPFNIGQAISLKGFQIHEAEPLEKGLRGKLNNPQVIMQEILQWTGGQPFLTQKLCQFMVEESEQQTPHLVEQVVKSRIIENWESQDEPEHLRTIRDRVINNQQRAVRLLGLYQEILEKGEIVENNSQEQVELGLSGLVVKQQGSLKIYNCIYDSVFNQKWVEQELTKLRPYSEALLAWHNSNCNDQSWLLRGKALRDAFQWKGNRSLSDLDYHFLVASQEAELAGQEVELSYLRLLEQTKSELEKSELRYHLLAEAIPQLIWTIDTKGVFIYINQRWLVYTGLTLAQVQNEGWQAVIHPDDMHWLDHNWAIARQDSISYQAEVRMRRADGAYRWHLILCISVKDIQERVVNWVGSCTDINDRKELEIERTRILQLEQVARNEAETANRLKDEFLAILSHELHLPLNPILGWSRLLQIKKLDEAQTASALASIERNAKLQNHLIESLLDVSRFMQGKLHLNVKPVDLQKIIEVSLDTIHLAAEAKSIQIQTSINFDLGQVLGDFDRLHQVVSELLNNAIKFTPYPGRIEVTLKQVASDAVIQISDIGVGISPEFISHLFEYFRQQDSSTTRKFGGLGLGLARVRHIVELHGGSVIGDSQGEGLGATFTVTLPLIPAPLQSHTDKSQSQLVTTLERVKVLIVDDDVDTREFIAFLLEHQGAIVTIAASTQEALALILQFQPDILLTDIAIPGMDGYNLIRQIRAIPPRQGGQIPAIALTAYVGNTDKEQIIAAGFQEYITKPVEPEELVRLIIQLLSTQNSH